MRDFAWRGANVVLIALGCCLVERPLGLGESQSAGWSAEEVSRAAGPIEGEAERLRGVEAAGTTLTAHKIGRYRTGQG